MGIPASCFSWAANSDKSGWNHDRRLIGADTMPGTTGCEDWCSIIMFIEMNLHSGIRT
jgi:hypothetical protein